MAVYLDDPNRILAGSDHGIYRSEDRGDTLGKAVVAHGGNAHLVNRHRPGGYPDHLCGNQTGGQSWSKLSVQMS